MSHISLQFTHVVYNPGGKKVTHGYFIHTHTTLGLAHRKSASREEGGG